MGPEIINVPSNACPILEEFEGDSRIRRDPGLVPEEYEEADDSGDERNETPGQDRVQGKCNDKDAGAANDDETPPVTASQYRQPED